MNSRLPIAWPRRCASCMTKRAGADRHVDIVVFDAGDEQRRGGRVISAVAVGHQSRCRRRCRRTCGARHCPCRGVGSKCTSAPASAAIAAVASLEALSKTMIARLRQGGAEFAITRAIAAASLWQGSTTATRGAAASSAAPSPSSAPRICARGGAQAIGSIPLTYNRRSARISLGNRPPGETASAASRRRVHNPDIHAPRLGLARQELTRSQSLAGKS